METQDKPSARDVQNATLPRDLAHVKWYKPTK